MLLAPRLASLLQSPKGLAAHCGALRRAYGSWRHFTAQRRCDTKRRARRVNGG